MYFVKYGKEYLHDPRTKDYYLLDLSLTCEANSCGYCDFTISPSHPMINKIRERDAANPIEVYDGDILLFAGFIYELGKEFYLDGHVKCKGELDYLSESIVRPYSTLDRKYGTVAPASVNGYFEWLIKQHNSQVDENKKFVVGINQGARLDTNNYIYRENDNYPTTIDEISEKILNNNDLGGYIRVRHEKGIRYIDLLSEWTDSNSQILDFGVNLTDYSETDNSEEIVTYVIPLGAKMNETDYSYDDGYFITSDTVVDPEKEYYTLSENNYYSKCDENMTSFEAGVIYYEYDWRKDESDLNLTLDDIYSTTTPEHGYYIDGDKIYCKEAVEKYGWIGKKYTNTDITTKEYLAAIGYLVLKQLISPKRTIEIKAVDMHLINPNIKPIRVGEYVRVRSNPHNLDSYFLCTNIDLNLNNPANSVYTLGTTYDTLTGQQNKKINELNDTINKRIDEVDALSEEAKATAKDAIIIAGGTDTTVNGKTTLLTLNSSINSSFIKPIDNVLLDGGYVEASINIKDCSSDNVNIFSIGENIESWSYLECKIMCFWNPSTRSLVIDQSYGIDGEKQQYSISYEGNVLTFKITRDKFYVNDEEITILSGHMSEIVNRSIIEVGFLSNAESETDSLYINHLKYFEIGALEGQDEALCALYEENLELQSRADETDDAICELYEMIIGE